MLSVKIAEMLSEFKGMKAFFIAQHENLLTRPV